MMRFLKTAITFFLFEIKRLLKNIHPWLSQRLSYNGYNSVSFLNFEKMKVALDSLCPCAYFAALSERKKVMAVLRNRIIKTFWNHFFPGHDSRIFKMSVSTLDGYVVCTNAP